MAGLIMPWSPGTLRGGGGAPFEGSWRFIGHSRENSATFTVSPEDTNRMLVATLSCRGISSPGTVTIGGVTATVLTSADTLPVMAAVAYAHVPTGTSITVTASAGTETWIGLWEIITERRAPQSDEADTGTSDAIATGLSGGETNPICIVVSAGNNGGNSITMTNATNAYEVDMNGGATDINVECRAEGHYSEGTTGMTSGAGGSNNMASQRVTWYED